jgi:hypothetical protein
MWWCRTPHSYEKLFYLSSLSIRFDFKFCTMHNELVCHADFVLCIIVQNCTTQNTNCWYYAEVTKYNLYCFVLSQHSKNLYYNMKKCQWLFCTKCIFCTMPFCTISHRSTNLYCVICAQNLCCAAEYKFLITNFAGASTPGLNVKCGGGIVRYKRTAVCTV